MQTILFEITALLAVIVFPLFILRKKIRTQPKRTPKYKIDTDTEYARYAINENGFLEEISESKLYKNKH